MVQQVKDLALSPQQLGSVPWCGFDLWPGNFHMLQTWPKKRKKQKKNNNKGQHNTGFSVSLC